MPPAAPTPAPNGSRADSLKPAQASLLVYGQSAAPKRPIAPPKVAPVVARPSMINRVGSLLESWGVSRFLQR